jgi:hypothetical protein
MLMRSFTMFTTLCLLPCFGCQWNGTQRSVQPFAGNTPVFQTAQPGQPQAFPQQAPPPPIQFAHQAGQFIGDMATGFVRSAVGGAGFTAGRDLWNTIVR